MKMVQLSAQTLPLFVGKLGERAPALCGAIPAEANYVAKVGLWPSQVNPSLNSFF